MDQGRLSLSAWWDGQTWRPLTGRPGRSRARIGARIGAGRGSASLVNTGSPHLSNLNRGGGGEIR